MDKYAKWLKDEMADYVREVFPKGTRVQLSKKWTKNGQRGRLGVVSGYGRQNRENLVVIHDGTKTAHTYHWSFIVPAALRGGQGKSPEPEKPKDDKHGESCPNHANCSYHHIICPRLPKCAPKEPGAEGKGEDKP